MSDEFINPQKEIQKLTSAIKQYTLILKTTVDPHQQARARKKLKELQAYKNRLIATFEFDEKMQGDDGEEKHYEENDFISRIKAKYPGKPNYDEEVYELNLYLDFFYTEFLAIFSERKMKLDFKFSLDRDNFHQNYLGVKSRLDDYMQEHSRIKDGLLNKEVELEMKRRIVKIKRNLFIETYRFFKLVQNFANELILDLETQGLKCLNGDQVISFEFIEEKRFLEGYTVKEALDELLVFSKEVTDFLNIPDFES
ncbi:MAG: hypothetical protein JXJ04_06770 [Spirochaetales bacterium]|nr:hypothetical protein [Spirochaetales bacterium]